MLVEVSIAVNYILSHLYTKLPRRRVDSFGEELERYMHAKYQQHWFPADPMRDSAYRCLNVGGPQVDLLLPEAAAVSGLDWSEIQACLPEGLVLSVDPGHVACQYHQPQFNMQDFNRYPGQPVWPSASVSLSSSGCSSASSSISSTNLTPTSSQITHQVLYCFQDSWFANNSNNNNNSNNSTSSVNNKNQWNDVTTGPVKTSRSDQEHGDSLATAAALSVLVDSEDNITSNLPSDVVQKTTTDPAFNGSSLPINSSNVENVDLTHVLFREAELKAVSSSGLDMLQISDSRMSTGTCLWPNSTHSTEAENNLITLMNGDLNVSLTASSQMTAVGDKSRTQLPLLNRSSSNPPQTDPSNPSLFHDYSALSAGNLSANANHMGPTISKLDPNGNPVFSGPTPPRMSAVYTQSTLSQLVNPNGNNHFVQKSISTPSFTAATFAQTKFGSTKLKTHTKRTPNRILSPTTVPQAFSAYTGSSLMGRDSVNMTNVGPAQRLAHGTGLDLNPIQRLLPSTMDLNMNQNGKPVQTMDLQTSFDTSERTNGFGANHANLVRRKLFPIPGVANANKDSIQPNLFDGLFPSAAEESKTSEDIFSNLNFSEPTSNSNKFWYNTSAPVCREAPNSAATNFLSGPDWLSVSQSFNPVDFLSSQQASKTVPPHIAHSSNILDNPSIGKSEDSSDLPEESFLSARMVNLLLEDDSTLDPIKDTQVNTTTSLAGDTADVSAHGQTVSKPASALESIITELGALKNTCTE